MSKTIDATVLEQDNYSVHLNVETQFGDMDVLGHINNVAIVKYYENTRSRFLMDVYGDKKHYLTGEYNFVIAEYSIKFLGETHFPEPVIIGTAIESLGNSSCHVRQAMYQEGRCVGLCHTAMVLVKSGKSMPIPDNLRARLQAHILV